MFLRLDPHTLIQTFKSWAQNAEARGHGNAAGILKRMSGDAQVLTQLPHDALEPLAPSQAVVGVPNLPPHDKPEAEWTPEESRAVQQYKQARAAGQGTSVRPDGSAPGAGQVVPPQVKAYEQVPSGVLGVPRTREEAYGAGSTTFQPAPQDYDAEKEHSELEARLGRNPVDAPDVHRDLTSTSSGRVVNKRSDFIAPRPDAADANDAST